MNKKYNIGLDIGTTSIGWAIVECDNQKIIKKGKERTALWGVRLFEEANTAEKRRHHRSTRRRYDRRRNRIKLLQEEFTAEINKVDKDFFTKLKESQFHENDHKNKVVKISKEERELIKNYHKEYKTIYHLRNKLITSTEKMDIRLVYLAIHHIIKYRGNFIYSNDKFSVRDINIEEKLKYIFELIIQIQPELDLPENYQEYINIQKLAETFTNPSKNDMKINVKNLLENAFNKNFINEFTKMLLGNTFDINKLFLLEEDKSIKISFKENDFEDKYDNLLDLLNDKFELLEEYKNLYDMIFLKNLFKGENHTNLSSLMVAKYDVHKNDLRLLKELFKEKRHIYNKIFRSKGDKNKCLYDKYITNKISYEDFIKELQKYISELDDIVLDSKTYVEYEDAKYRMSNGDFLPRITDKENGKYPYQLNKAELIKILENQGQYYPFLLQKTDNKYKIVQLLEFKIPYYVGPLVSENQSQFAWMERKVQNVRITPYNFDEVIDKELTAEKFIKRMISHCTYFLEEYALPNNSILYSQFKVYNELKQIKINGYKLNNEQQHFIYENFFLKESGSLTDSKFKKFIYTMDDYFDIYGTDINVTGYSADGKFANSMQSYIDFFGENGIFENTNYDESDAEKIIEWITIFDDKDILENKVRNNYPELNDSQIKKILTKKYSGWGNLSKELLTCKYYKDKKTEVPKSILDLMYETEENFMQILNNEEYKFQDMIKERNKKDDRAKLDYKLVDDLATSPANKRGIYQALRVIKELVDYMEYEPESIIIEMARSTENYGRKDDRKTYLKKLYENSKEEISNYKMLMDNLEKTEKIDSEKLYLYFIQEGKCLYSGEPLDIYNLSSEEYEVDHILPRTLIKDDSFDNKALVYRKYNQDKKDSFVLPERYRTTENLNWWKHLKKINLISAKKFDRLVRKEYKDKDIQGFINRQLVETRQITKHVANIISNFYPKTKVVYLKANLSHSYRERYELFKIREINDYHHAHDAYLAAVLGEYKEKFMKKNINFEMIVELNKRLKEHKDYKKLKYGYVINSLDDIANDIINDISKNFIDDETGEVLFDAKLFNKRVEDTLYRNDILISKKTEIRTGEFYDESIYKKDTNGVPLKKNMPTSMYGLHKSIKPAYAVMVNYTYKGKNKRKLVGLPIYILKEKNSDSTISYLRKLLKLDENDSCIVISKPVPFFSLLNWKDQICYLVGASDTVEVCNAKQFKYDKDFYKKHKYALNKIFNNPKYQIDETDYGNLLENIIDYIVEKIEKEYELFANLVQELKEIVMFKTKDRGFTIEEKEKIIIQLTNLLNCKSDNADFKFLSSNFSSAFGKKNDRIIETVGITHLSVTGIRRNNYEL